MPASALIVFTSYSHDSGGGKTSLVSKWVANAPRVPLSPDEITRWFFTRWRVGQGKE